MGANISGLVVDPILGIITVVLAVLAIIEQRGNEPTKAKWYAIGAVAMAIFGIIANLFLAVEG